MSANTTNKTYLIEKLRESGIDDLMLEIIRGRIPYEWEDRFSKVKELLISIEPVLQEEKQKEQFHKFTSYFLKLYELLYSLCPKLPEFLVKDTNTGEITKKVLTISKGNEYYLEIQELIKRALDAYSHLLERDNTPAVIIADSKKQKLEENNFPHKLPRGTKWQNFIIKFLDNERVHIEVQGKKHDADFRELGFDDGRSGRSDQQWALLLLLAEHNGELNWKNPEAHLRFKKCVERLAEGLQNYFKIGDDPFFPYRDRIPSMGKDQNSYKIRVTLIPPPREEREQIKNDADTISQEITEMFKQYEEDGRDDADILSQTKDEE